MFQDVSSVSTASKTESVCKEIDLKMQSTVPTASHVSHILCDTMFQAATGAMGICLHVDTWMDGWIDGLLGGWINAWMDGRMDRSMEEYMHLYWLDLRQLYDMWLN